MRYTLRVEVHADGRWTYHLGRAGFVTDCGAAPTNPATEAEEASALRSLLGHDEGDAAWCPKCRAQLGEWIDLPADGAPDGPAAWRQRAAEAEALDPDPHGGNA
jgi:hypothetical protein